MEDLKQELSKLKDIYDGLKDNGAFQQFIETFKEDARIADEHWQFVWKADDENFIKLRAYKLAYILMTQKLDGIKARIDELAQEISEDLKEQS